MSHFAIMAAITDCDWYAVLLAQCQLTVTPEILRIQIDDRLWVPVVDHLGLLCPCRLEVDRVELWRHGQLWQSVAIGFWLGYPAA